MSSGVIAASFVAALPVPASMTRLYLPSAGGAPVSPAFGSVWETTSEADRRMLVLVPSDTPQTKVLRYKYDLAASVDTLARQYVSFYPLRTTAISGTAKLVVPVSEAGLNTQAFMQLMIRVVSANGGTVRGNLYSGQTLLTESSSPGAPNYQWPASDSVTATRTLTVPLNPVTPQAGDRLVVEIGYRANTTSVSRSANLYFGDKATAASDYSGAVDEALNANKRPWIELATNDDLFDIVPVSRFYFPSAGTPTITTAFASGWESVGPQQASTPSMSLPLAPSPTDTPLAAATHLPVVSGNDTAHRQFISGPLAAGAISGTFTLVMCGSTNGSLDPYLQAIIRVVSADGTVVRGTLYAGQTLNATSAVSTDPNYKWAGASLGSISGSLSRVLIATMTPVTAQAGDRLVVEVGSRAYQANNLSRYGTMAWGDPSALPDFPQSVNLDATTGRSWIAFSNGIQVTV